MLYIIRAAYFYSFNWFYSKFLILIFSEPLKVYFYSYKKEYSIFSKFENHMMLQQQILESIIPVFTQIRIVLWINFDNF